MRQSLSFLAGRQALALIREYGLIPDLVQVVAGAAGGPKWLVLSRLDQAVFGTFFKNRTQPLYLLGSSIGAWRFAMAGQIDPVRAIRRFEHFYIHQTYTDRPTMEEVTMETMRIQHACLTETGIREVLDHPQFRLNMLAVRCKGPTASDNRGVLGFGLALALAGNLLSRRSLGLFFERTLFTDPRDIPPFFNMNQFPIHKTPLTPMNIRKALLASGSIPLVMSAVRRIDGAAAGVYRDGGVIDYHLDLPLTREDESIALFPHYSERLIPGWFDKRLRWRRPSPAHLENVLLVAPTRDFIRGLPMAKIPDRNDFQTFFGRDRERIETWEKTAAACDRLADDFLEAVASGKIRDLVKPL